MTENHEVFNGSDVAENGESMEPHSVLVMDDATASGEALVNDDVTVDKAATIDSTDQDNIDKSNEALLAEGSFVENMPSDLRVTEEAGKEEMFVDCAEELVVSDNKEAVAIYEDQRLDEEDDVDVNGTHARKSDSENQAPELMAELVYLRGMLEKTISEKEGAAKDYKEEKGVLEKELGDLHSQLRNLNGQLSLLNENNGGSVDGVHEDGLLDEGQKVSFSSSQLHDVMNECSKLVRNVLDVRSHAEVTTRELHEALSMKNQEIAELHAKIHEISISQDAIISTLSSAKSWSDSLQESPQVQHDQHHLETITNGTLGSLAVAVDSEKLTDESIPGRMSHIEKKTSLLVEMYNHFLSDMDSLKQCLTEVMPELSIQNDQENALVAACRVVLELKRKEGELNQKVSFLEDANKEAVEKLDQVTKMAQLANLDVEKLGVELEQEKNRFANTKEKLSMAVTKGKALVQQRDSLKQALASKTSELEKCLSDLQEKSIALEAAAAIKEEVVEAGKLAASMQEALSQRDAILTKCEEILSQIPATQDYKPDDILERITLLVNERNALKDEIVEYHKLIDILSLIDFPETISSSDLGSQVNWLVESFSSAKIEASELKNEILRTGEATEIEIERLSTSLVMESQEKNFIQEELEDLTHKHREIVEKECQVSLENNRIISRLLEASGLSLESQEAAEESPSDVTVFIDRCLNKVKQESNAINASSHFEPEMFEGLQTLLYTKDQELMLHEMLLEEDALVRSDYNSQLEDLKRISQQLQDMKDEKTALQKDLDRSEEKFSLLREKLSMAVKKGKGLVQDRENLRKLQEEKTAEIERLKSELKQQELAVADFKDQISKLSADVELIPKLEADLTSMKESKDQLEQFLAQSNGMLQRVIEAVDSFALPVDSTFEEPVEKVQWLVKYLNECQVSKVYVEEKLEKLKAEAIALSTSSAEAYAAKKSLEETLLVAENNVSQLAEEKRELELSKAYMEQELHRLTEEASLLAGKFAEACATRKSLEDALSEAESKISSLITESEDAHASRAAAEMELEKLKEESNVQTSTTSEAFRTIKSLEDALSQAKENVFLLSEENSKAQSGITSLEDEIKKLKEEGDLQANKLADAQSEAFGTIKSLEDALSQAKENVFLLSEENNKAQSGITSLEDEIKKLKEEGDLQANELADARSEISSLKDTLLEAENDISDLQANKLADARSEISSLKDALLKAESEISALLNEKKISEEELSALNSKLSSCMEELSGSYGKSESISLELSRHLNALQLLSSDDTLFSFIKECFKSKFVCLKDMENLLKDMNTHFTETGSAAMLSDPISEEDLLLSRFQPGIDDMDNTDSKEGAGNSFEVPFRRVVEHLRIRDKAITDDVQLFSSSMDDYIAALLTRLQETRDQLVIKLDEMRLLNQTINSLETDMNVKDNTIALLENDIALLASACYSATRELEIETKSITSKLSSSAELEKLNDSEATDSIEDIGAHQERLDSGKYVSTADNLFLAARKIQTLTKHLENELNTSFTTLKDLENKLTETRTSFDKVIVERDSNQNRLSELESDLEALHNSNQDMRAKLEDYQEKEHKFTDLGREMSSLHNTLLMKEKESEDTFLSKSQVKTLCDKINDIDVHFEEFKGGKSEFHEEDYATKLFYIIDNFTSMTHQISLLSHDKEELQSTLEKEVRQIEHLLEEVEEHNKDRKELEKVESDLFELQSGLDLIIQKLGGNNLSGERKSADVKGLLPVLEKLAVAAVKDAENSKSKAQELGSMLQGNQTTIDELSTKVKVLEHSNRSSSASLEAVRDKSILEAPSLPNRSEIIEIEDAGPMGKKAIASTSSAPHVRTLHKGSSDHLAINIDPESERLINHEETDEDKGHLFKPLNTSGLIPVQGKLIADRVDGIWVSGGRALMSRPRARLGFIAYCLLVHLWLLVAIV